MSATFKNNKTQLAGSKGGAVFNNNSIDSIESSTFTNNESAYCGAIYNSVTGVITKLFKVTAGNSSKSSLKNVAYQSGGAIFNEGEIFINAFVEWLNRILFFQQFKDISSQFSGTLAFPISSSVVIIRAFVTVDLVVQFATF
jgi:hypothetical protein